MCFIVNSQRFLVESFLCAGSASCVVAWCVTQIIIRHCKAGREWSGPIWQTVILMVIRYAITHCQQQNVDICGVRDKQVRCDKMTISSATKAPAQKNLLMKNSNSRN
jgi:hypothetical protein